MFSPPAPANNSAVLSDRLWYPSPALESGLRYFLFVRGTADRYFRFDSVGLSLELVIVYQLERLLQMADKPHFCGEFATFSYRLCESPISAVKKAKKYRTDTFDLYGT